MAFNAFEYCRKHGTGKTTVKTADGIKIQIPGLPEKFQPAHLAKLAAAAEEIKVSFPEVDMGGGKSAIGRATLTGEFAEGMVKGVFQDEGATVAGKVA